MKSKTMKIGGALLGLGLMAILALPYVVNVDSLRPQLESRLQSHLGREVHIGHLEFSLLAGGARAEDLSIADDPTIRSGSFLRAKSLEVGISLFSIFSRSLRVTSLTIKEPELILAKSASGKWNFSSLGASDEFGADGEPGTPLSSFLLDRLKITDATLVFPDSAKSGQAVLKNISIDLRSSPIDGRATVFASTQSDSGKIELHGEAGPLNRENPERTPFHIIVNGSKFNLAEISHLNAPAGIGGILFLDASLTSDGRVLHTEATARAEKLRVGPRGAMSRQPVSLRCMSDYSVARHVGSLNHCEVSVRKSIARIGGTYQLRGDSLIAHFRLASSELPLDDVEGVLPALGIQLPGDSKLHGGTVNASVAFDGPLDHMVTSGTVQLENAHLSGFDLGSKLSSITALKGDNPGSNLAIVRLSSAFRIAPQGTHISNFKTQISGIGALSGEGNIDSADNLQFAMVANVPNDGWFHKGLDHLGLKSVPENIPFKVVGTTSHPIFLPDLRGVIRNTGVNAVQQGVQMAQLKNTDNPINKVRTAAPKKAESAAPVTDAPSAKRKGGIWHKLFHPRQRNQTDETELPKR
jgi:AsmA protein